MWDNFLRSRAIRYIRTVNCGIRYLSCNQITAVRHDKFVVIFGWDHVTYIMCVTWRVQWCVSRDVYCVNQCRVIWRLLWVKVTRCQSTHPTSALSLHHGTQTISNTSVNFPLYLTVYCVIWWGIYMYTFVIVGVVRGLEWRLLSLW